jgi:rhodanese-related sulfurtransferase
MSQPQGVPSITPADAAAARAAAGADPHAPLLVDVREADEYATERAEGAVLLPISVLAKRHEELPRDRPLLMICQSGSRSMSATMFLLQRGWTDVRNVDGGTTAWVRAGLPARRGEPAAGEGDLP